MPSSPLSEPVVEAFFPEDMLVEDPETGTTSTALRGTPTKLTTKLVFTPVKKANKIPLSDGH